MGGGCMASAAEIYFFLLHMCSLPVSRATPGAPDIWAPAKKGPFSRCFDVKVGSQKGFSQGQILLCFPFIVPPFVPPRVLGHPMWCRKSNFIDHF